MCMIKHSYLKRAIRSALWEQSLACVTPQYLDIFWERPTWKGTQLLQVMMEVVQLVANQCPSLSPSYLSSVDHSVWPKSWMQNKDASVVRACLEAFKHVVEVVITSETSAADIWSACHVLSLLTLVLFNKYSECGPACVILPQPADSWQGLTSLSLLQEGSTEPWNVRQIKNNHCFCT